MKIFFVMLALVLALGTPVFADDSMNIETFFAIEKLDNGQKMFYLGLLSAVDYYQTVETVVKQPGVYREINPILGEHPSRQSLALFGVAGVAAVYAVQRIFPEARVLVDSIIASEQVNIWENQYSMNRTRMSIPVMVVVSYQF